MDRYITDRFLPDKAIDLIDETGSRKIKTYALPSELKALEQELKKISREKSSLSRCRTSRKPCAIGKKKNA